MLDWRTVAGFGEHDFAGFYEEAIAQAPAGALLVEVGLYHGRSLIQLAQTAQAANKGLRVIGVDWGRAMGDPQRPHAAFLANLLAAGLADTVPLIIAPSVEAARLFADQSCWMVFLDASHDRLDVRDDILAWMPKIAPDGWLAGHDIRWHYVCEAVHALLDGVIHDPRYDNCWKARKQAPRAEANIYAPTTIPQTPRT